MNNSKNNVVLILGPPAAGKGTQCAKIQTNFHLQHISAGDMLREFFPIGSPEREIMDRGGFVTPEKVNEIMQIFIEKYNHKVILDGYPRSAQQAEFIRRVDISHVIVLWSQDYDRLLQRCLHRTQCSKCKTIYDRESVCCELSTNHRADDIESVFKKRFDLFVENIFPILCTLNKPAYFVDANKDINTVWSEIHDILS